MDLYQAIEKRCTIRAFKGPATQAQLEKIIVAGTKAPSAVNRQPWEFIVVEDEEILEALSDIKYRQTLDHPPDTVKGNNAATQSLAQAQKDLFQNASIVVVCHETDWERSVWMCIQNMSLAAVAEGLGSGISLYWGEDQAAAGELLGLPDNYEVTAILKIGVPAEEGFARDQNPYKTMRPELSWLHQDRF